MGQEGQWENFAKFCVDINLNFKRLKNAIQRAQDEPLQLKHGGARDATRKVAVTVGKIVPSRAKTTRNSQPVQCSAKFCPGALRARAAAPHMRAGSLSN